MTISAPSPLRPLLAKLDRIEPLAEADRDAILQWPSVVAGFSPRAQILAEGGRPVVCPLLVEGIAACTKLTTDGRRQIVSFHFPGDMLGLQGLFFSDVDHGLEAVTRVVVAEIAYPVIHAAIESRPSLARSLWQNGLLDACIFREWILNVGRRDARTRIAHLLCEFGIRAAGAGLGRPDDFPFPITQEQLADATGLTPIHVNRTLRALRAEGLIHHRSRRIVIPNLLRLREIGDFNATYLHRLAVDQPARHQLSAH